MKVGRKARKSQPFYHQNSPKGKEEKGSACPAPRGIHHKWNKQGVWHYGVKHEKNPKGVCNTTRGLIRKNAFKIYPAKNGLNRSKKKKPYSGLRLQGKKKGSAGPKVYKGSEGGGGRKTSPPVGKRGVGFVPLLKRRDNRSPLLNQEKKTRVRKNRKLREEKRRY